MSRGAEPPCTQIQSFGLDTQSSLSGDAEEPEGTKKKADRIPISLFVGVQ